MNAKWLVRGVLLFLSVGFTGCASLGVGESREVLVAQAGESDAETEEQRSGHGVILGVLLYIPNRLLDLIDPFRLRLRAGPGLGAGIRATSALDAYLGSYIGLFIGLPGPRMRPLPRLPVGVEQYSGIGFSIIDATVDVAGPDYSPSEFGINLHLLLIGGDIGLDPLEVIDFLTGLLMIDIRDDDF